MFLAGLSLADRGLELGRAAVPTVALTRRLGLHREPSRGGLWGWLPSTLGGPAENTTTFV